MLRTSTLLAAALFVLLAGGQLLAQDAWPAYSTGSADPHFLSRGPGFYLALWKLVLLALLVWLWVKQADWVGRDTVEVGNKISLPGQIWNPVMVFSFMVAFLLAITIPIFPAGLGLLAVSAVVPFAVYVVQRNGKVTAD